jgi:hypothetical protein
MAKSSLEKNATTSSKLSFSDYENFRETGIDVDYEFDTATSISNREPSRNFVRQNPVNRFKANKSSENHTGSSRQHYTANKTKVLAKNKYKNAKKNLDREANNFKYVNVDTDSTCNLRGDEMKKDEKRGLINSSMDKIISFFQLMPKK